MRRVLLLLAAALLWLGSPVEPSQFIVRVPSGQTLYYTGTVRTPATCSVADVQTEITNAVSRDIVRLPASCSITWNSIVTVPSTKGIWVDFNSATITCGTPCSSNNSPIFRITTNATISSRASNVTFTSSGGSDALEVFMEVSTSASNALFRLDHCTFTGDAIGFHLQVSGPGYGLIDHCAFNWNGNNEVIQHEAYGPGSETGWLNDVTIGSDQQLVVENTTFTNSASSFLGGKTSAFYGSVTTYRFNTFIRACIDNHGTAGNVGARWWELYKNSFQLNNGDNVSVWIQNRAGSGFIFDNAVSNNTNAGAGTITLWEEDTGYPALYQIGRGKCTTSCATSSALTPAYLWLRDADSPLTIDEASPGTQIQANRDYYTQGGSFDGTTGVGVGVIGSRPGTCTTGVAYWATDEGEWDSTHGGADGRLYVCTSTNTWTLSYTPLAYPHHLIAELV